MTHIVTKSDIVRYLSPNNFSHIGSDGGLKHSFLCEMLDHDDLLFKLAFDVTTPSIYSAKSGNNSLSNFKLIDVQKVCPSLKFYNGNHMLEFDDVSWDWLEEFFSDCVTQYFANQV